jgi:hypothetical protein
MRAALIPLLAALAAAPAGAAVPLALAERQVVTLEFDRPPARVATTDPDLVSVKATGTRLSVTALRAGRATLEVAFADGATISYEVQVDGAKRPAARATGPNELELGVAEERRFRAPGIERLLVEENGVARVAAEGETVSVVGVAPGAASLVVVGAGGAKTVWHIRVR